MRKMVLSMICLLGMSGLLLATEVTLIKHDPDKGEVKVKDGDKETVLKYNDKTKVTFIDRDDGTSKEGTLEAALKLFNTEKLVGKLKFEVTTDKDTIVELKIKGKKKKN
jgi:hypothetical protein